MRSVKTPRKMNPVDAHVGSRVRSLRIKMRMSQSDLGDRLGITFQQIQKYEKGANRISSSRLLQISQVFGVSPPYFFEDPLVEVAPHERVDLTSFDKFCASREGISLMQAFVKIKNKAMRSMIAKLVGEIAG